MVSGLKTEFRQIIGLCKECRYSAEEIMQEYPVGTGPDAIEATGIITHGAHEVYLVVFPHRPTCSSHTSREGCGA